MAMIKFIKLLIGLLLLPLCTAATLCAIELLSEAATADYGAMTPEEWALPAGFMLWSLIYFLFPKPWRTYVLGHELTHALWGVMMGARVGKMKVKGDGGSVELSKTNFVISLSPYFFPLYTVIVILVYLVADFFIDISPWRGLALALIGFTWSFHVTFTLAMLTQQQSDISENGRLFSYSIIYLFNLIGVCCWITAVGQPTWNRFISTLLEQSAAWYETVWEFFSTLSQTVPEWTEGLRHKISPR